MKCEHKKVFKDVTGESYYCHDCESYLEKVESKIYCDRGIDFHLFVSLYSFCLPMFLLFTKLYYQLGSDALLIIGVSGSMLLAIISYIWFFSSIFNGLGDHVVHEGWVKK